MRSFVCVNIHNSLAIDFINSHLAGRVNDLMFIYEYTHMSYLSFIIVEEC